MSMVAGSVLKIAKIQAISGVKVVDIGGNIIGLPSSAVLGSDKDPVGMFDYRDPNGVVVSQPTAPSVDSGWGLIDGAILAKNVGGLSGARVFERPS